MKAWKSFSLYRTKAEESGSTMEAWQHDRISLNHDWLKNQVNMALIGGIFPMFRHGNIPDCFFNLTNFINASAIIPWSRRNEELGKLLDRLLHEMSPRLLLERQPLSNQNLDTKAWISPLIDTLWRHRKGLMPRIDEARAIFDATQQKYINLKQQLQYLHEPCLIDDLRPFEPMFKDFYESCCKLSVAMHSLPIKIEVI